MTRWLFFERRKPFKCWTQTCDAGAKSHPGFSTAELARKFCEEQDDLFPEFEHVVIPVELPD